MKIESVLQSARPREALSDRLIQADRFTFFEALRLSAVNSYRQELITSGVRDAEARVALADNESQIIQRQFELMDGIVVSTLEKDGAKSLYDNYNPTIDLDLPDDPDTLRDSRVAYRYAMRRLYRRQFDVTMAHERKDGCWPVVCFDLLDDLNARRTLIVESVPESVANHASTAYINSIGRSDVNRMKTVYRHVFDDAKRRLSELDGVSGSMLISGRGRIIVKVLTEIIDWALRVTGILEMREAALDAWDKAQREREREREARQLEREARERFERDLYDATPIPEGSGHMDRFEKNRDWIGGLS